MEAVVIREALSWVKDRRKDFVIMEIDCLHMAQAVNSLATDDSTFGLIINDCKNILATLQHVRVAHVKRSANTAAHRLARVAVFMSGFHV